MVVTPRLGERMASSCSFWMVATTECMYASRALDSWAIRAPSPTTAMPSGAASASSSSSSTPVTARPRLRSTRRRTTPDGSCAVAW